MELRSEIRIANDRLVLAKPLLSWINDLGMAMFFLPVGLETKREMIEGELASLRQAALPAIVVLGAWSSRR
jgi:NhaA family Na+:H+ antiporter